MKVIHLVIAKMLEKKTPEQIVAEGFASYMEDYLHTNGENLPDDQAKAIMKALKIIP